LKTLPPDADNAIRAIFPALLKDPTPDNPQLEIRHYSMASYPYTFTLAFGSGKGFLVYELMADLPIIKILEGTWLD
jgi:hypothetical protein